MKHFSRSGFRKFGNVGSRGWRAFASLLVVGACCVLWNVLWNCSKDRIRIHPEPRQVILFEFVGFPGFSNRQPWKMTIDDNGLAVLSKSEDFRHWIPVSEIGCRDRDVVHQIWSALPKQGDFFEPVVIDARQVEVRVLDRASGRSWNATVPDCSRGPFSPFGWLGDERRHPFVLKSEASNTETQNLINLFWDLARQYEPDGAPINNPRANQ